MIANAVYAARRERVAKMIGDDAVLVLWSGEAKVRSRDVHYPFCADKYFYYLTGSNDADSWLVIAPNAGDDSEVMLFCVPYDRDRALWEGERLHPHNVRERLAIDAAFPVNELSSRLTALLRQRRCLYACYHTNGALPRQLAECVAAAATATRTQRSCLTDIRRADVLLNRHRLCKSTEEVASMREAAAISIAAHEAVMHQAHRAPNEAVLAATFVGECMRRGAAMQAYPPIVAAGANACVLHYHANNAAIADDALVLIDAGCEYDGYAADITRTFPRSGHFSAEQRALYDIVLAAQQAVIARIRAGVRWAELERCAVRVLTEGLCELGLVPGDVDTAIANEAYKPFYMHRIGHWLGLDVHDVGDYHDDDGNMVAIAAGSVLTVEPGLYCHPALHHDSPFVGIGIRIEDNVLVTAEGATVLTAALPSHPDAVAALVRDGAA